MSHSQKRKNSCIRHFRMDVPKDIQHLVGKTSWQHSLRTIDPHLADTRNAYHLAHYKQEVIRLRAMVASNLEARAEAVVEKAFDGLAASYGSMDKAVATELDSLALTVRGSWSQEDAQQAEREILGEEISTDWVADDGAIDVFDERGRQNFKLRAEIFESREETYGLVYQELARSLLERGLHDPLHYQVACMAYGSGDLKITSRPAFEAIARAYLKRLAQHEFSSWPENLREALAPVVQSSSNEHSTGSASNSLTAPIIKVAGRTLDAAFHLWRARKGYRPGERHKTAVEAGTHPGARELPLMVEAFAGIKTHRGDAEQIPLVR